LHGRDQWLAGLRRHEPEQPAATSNYLSFTVRLPIAQDAAERLLAQPFALSSVALRERLDALLLPLCAADTGNLRYFADAPWIDAHLAFLPA